MGPSLRNCLFRYVLCVAAAVATGCGSDQNNGSSSTRNDRREDSAELQQLDSVQNAADEQGAAESATTLPADPVKTATSPEVVRLLAEAEQATTAGQLPRAIELLSQCLAVDPNNGEASYQRGRAYADLGQNANALADLAAAVQARPEEAAWWNTKGFFLLTRGSTEAALADLNRAIELQMDFAEAWNNRGMVHMARKDAEQAIVDFTTALKHRPQYVDALNNRGFARMQLGRLPEAIADFDAALAIDSAAVNPLNNRGLAHYRQGDFVSAVADFTEAIVARPENPRYYRHRQQTWEQLGKIREAMADRQRAELLEQLAELDLRVKANPQNAEAWLGRGRIHRQLNHPARALSDFRMASERNPRLANAWLERARVRLAQQEYQAAVDLCDRAISLNPGPEMYSVRGDAWFGLQDYGRAVADFEKARRIDTVVARAWQQHAAQLQSAGDLQAASVARQRATRLLSQARAETAGTPARFPD